MTEYEALDEAGAVPAAAADSIPVESVANRQWDARPETCEPPVIKVLIVDANPADIVPIERSIRRMVRHEAQVATAGSLAAGQFCAVSDDFDLIVVDYDLGGERGIDLLASLSGGVVVMVTDEPTPVIAREAAEHGAVTCLGKNGLSPRLLETTFERARQARGQQQCATLAPQHGQCGPALWQPSGTVPGAVDPAWLMGGSDLPERQLPS